MGQNQSHPLDALLEQARDMSFPQRVHQLPGRMVRRHQLNAIDEAIKFLLEEVSRKTEAALSPTQRIMLHASD